MAKVVTRKITQKATRELSKVEGGESLFAWTFSQIFLPSMLSFSFMSWWLLHFILFSLFTFFRFSAPMPSHYIHTKEKVVEGRNMKNADLLREQRPNYSHLLSRNTHYNEYLSQYTNQVKFVACLYFQCTQIETFHLKKSYSNEFGSLWLFRIL